MRRVSHLGDLGNRQASDLQGLPAAVQALTKTHVTEYQTPLTGFTLTPANTTNTLILEPAGALLAGTVNMPDSPVDGQIFGVVCTQAITTLTIVPGGGQIVNGLITAIIANGYATWLYRATNSTWYRCG